MASDQTIGIGIIEIGWVAGEHIKAWKKHPQDDDQHEIVRRGSTESPLRYDWGLTRFLYICRFIA